MFRKTRISNEQLLAILRSLPQAKASSDFEQHLDRMIASNSHHVPNLLGSLPLVPAPDDFDARLMEAIRDRRRPVAPIPIAVAAGGASINWLNHIMGWIGGSLAVVALAFFINHATEVAPNQAATVPVQQPAAGGTVTAPAVVTPSVAARPATPAVSGSARDVAAVQAEPRAAAITGMTRTRSQDAAPVVRVRDVVAPSAAVTVPLQQAPTSTAPAVNVESPGQTAAQHDQRTLGADPAVNSGEVATGPNKTDSSAASVDNSEINVPAPDGGVNPGVDTNKPH